MVDGPLAVPMELLELMVGTSPAFSGDMPPGVDPLTRIYWCANESMFNDRLDRPFAVISNRLRYVRDGISDLYELRAQGELHLLLSRDATFVDDMKQSSKDFLTWVGLVVNDVAEKSGHGESAAPIIGIEQETEPLRTIHPQRDEEGRYDFWQMTFLMRYGF